MKTLEDYTKSQQKTLLTLVKYAPWLKERNYITKKELNALVSEICKHEWIGYPKFLLDLNTSGERLSRGTYVFPEVILPESNYPKEFIDELIENGITPKL